MRNTELPDLSAEWTEDDARLAIGEWRRSGQTIAAFARAHHICPHFSLRLNHRAEQFTTRDGEIMCSMHFALFRMDDGVCIEGACPGRALDPVPVEITPRGALRIAGPISPGRGRGPVP